MFFLSGLLALSFLWSSNGMAMRQAEQSEVFVNNKTKPVLKFNEGKFKIVQFTDLHVNGEKKADWQVVYQRVDDILAEEQPDLIVLTGDIVCKGKRAAWCLDCFLNFLNTKKIAFALVFGNHDDETDASRTELMKIAEKFAYNLSVDEQPSLYGTSNYVLEVNASNSARVKALLYCLDSNAYSKMKGVDGYDYIHQNQIDWYRHRSSSYAVNNAGTPLPALAFFHIPLPEYRDAVFFEETNFYGCKNEHVASPELNSGLFTAMKEQGDVMGVFAGHEHDNDFIVGWYGIALAYGRVTGIGADAYGKLPAGARVIELQEGERRFKSWIRSDMGVEQQTVYPDSFWKSFEIK